MTVGVLIADTQHLKTDRAAGVRLATLEVEWDRWEPAKGKVATAYVNALKAEAKAYRSAGFAVSVDVGLQHAPGWVLALPDGQLTDQRGAASGTPNWFFSAAVRTSGAAYVKRVVAALGSVQSYRVGLSPHGEALYPDAPDDQWWAFDRLAQGTVSGRPSGVSASPMPGWVPGTATWRGAKVTVAQVQRWYDWYLGASVNAHQWEIGAFRAAGHSGMLMLVVPGTGTTPYVDTHRIASLLKDQSYDAFHTMNAAASWPDVLAGLTGRNKLAVDISSVYDQSGVPRGNACQAGDQSATPMPGTWSSTRWLAYLSQHFGYAATYGESTGDNSPGDVPEVFSLARSCGISVLQWAWDYQLYDGTHASIDDLADAISG